jgi:phosphoribosylformimino-5-aminoimidazole carboxamide ribotide isomerase
VVVFGQQRAAIGVTHVVFPDIRRDGTLEGATIEASALLGEQTGMQVIVSGGVAGPDDIRRAKAADRTYIHGIIIGRALYTGNVDLTEALAIAAA